MYNNKEELARNIAIYIVEKRCTVRAAAKVYSIGKTTVHNYMVRLLKKIDMGLFLQVKKVLKVNLSERHIRGGLATKKRFLSERLSSGGC